MDYQILKFFNSLAGKKEWLDILLIILGDYLIIFIPIIIFLVYFFSKRRKKIYPLLLQILVAFGLIYLFVYLIGLLVARPRPFISHQDIYQLDKFFSKSTDFSFPSHHAAVAFIFAWIILFDWRRFGAIILVLSSLAGLGRVFMGVHYLTDIIAGALISLIVVLLIRKFLLKYIKYGNT
jgi:undecaprenyl-diphosphatase